MKAWVLHDIGSISYEDVDRPVPKGDWALVRVGAAGICGSDVPRVFDTGAHRMPIITGHEFAGTVTELGSDADPSWLGKRVGVFPLIPCRKCPQCTSGQYELCRDYDYVGSRRDGAFAEYVTVPCSSLVALPDNVTFEIAAMLEPMAVAVHALRRVIRAEDGRDISIAVYGLGTIGMFLVMFLMEAGYRNLYLIGNKDRQRQDIISMGIEAGRYHDSREAGAEAELLGTGGADIVFECVGSGLTYAGSIDIAAPMGRVVLIGNPHSDMQLPKNTYWKILRNQLTLTGTWNSSFTGKPDDDWHYVLERLERGSIDPVRFITHRYPMQRLKDGLDIMHDKSEEYGKIMIS